jgi:hypothetical protein
LIWLNVFGELKGKLPFDAKTFMFKSIFIVPLLKQLYFILKINCKKM